MTTHELLQRQGRNHMSRITVQAQEQEQSGEMLHIFAITLEFGY